MAKTATPKPAARGAAASTAGSAKTGVETAKEDVTPVAVKADPASEFETDLKKRELIDLVVEQSGIKKKFAKPVVETMLRVLGQAMADERELNLQPFGKLMVQKIEDKPNARIVKCRLRQSKPAENAIKEALDTAAE